jgi:hypothetical protein
VNTCYGGFSLSEAAVVLYAELSGFPLQVEKDGRYTTLEISHFFKTDKPVAELTEQERGETYYSPHCEIKRDDPMLVQVVEQLGEDSWGSFAQLKIVEIPDGVEWNIEEYDGTEWIAETHRTWN